MENIERIGRRVGEFERRIDGEFKRKIEAKFKRKKDRDTKEILIGFEVRSHQCRTIKDPKNH